MSDTGDNRDNYCYRHPDRQSFILCQRCGRTVCPQCSTQASVGVHCPECIKEAKANAPRRQPITTRAARSLRSSSDRPVVTYAIIALCVVVYGVQAVTQNAATSELIYIPRWTFIEPWRLLTSMFAHAGPLHLLLNMYSLFILGRLIEPALGHVRFAALYLLSGIGGSIAVLYLAPHVAVLGASGAIFGLFGALFVIVRRLGGNPTQIVIILGINLVIGFVLPGIAWEAHVGGLVVGALVAAIYVRTRRTTRLGLQISLFAAVGLALAALAVIRLAV